MTRTSRTSRISRAPRVATVAVALVALVAAPLAVLAPSSVAAQQRLPTPRAGYVYPAGGERGTTLQVTVGGQSLNGTANAFVSGGGIRVRVVKVDLPILGLALTNMRDTAQALLKQLQERGLPDPVGQRLLLALRDTISDSMRRQANPALAHLVTLEVTIDPAAPPGPRFLRLQSPLGLTNPLVFCVGQLPEYSEKVEKATRADAELAITLPATVNGRLVPGDIGRRNAPVRPQAGQYQAGDVDRYRFAARRGQQLVAAVSARALIPYLGDAVPGWAQTTLTLYDANGHELAYADDWRGNPDPVLHFEVPSDGEYVIEMKDALFRGRDDFVYRMAIGELPFITDVFPLGGRPGARTELAMTGWNLPATRDVLDAARSTPGMHSLNTSRDGVWSNRVAFVVDSLPSAAEREPNDTTRIAQAVTLPMVVNGRIDRPGDRDAFSFSGRAGESVVAEVTARRLGSPLDAVLELVDAEGKRLAWNDDHEDRGSGLLTHHADSWLMATLPRTGTYIVRLGDVQRNGGPEYSYRLRLSAPRPDFELRASPSSVNVSAGGSAVVTVTAIRRDGFTGEIRLGLTSAPSGVTWSGGLIPAGQDQVRMTIASPPLSAAGPALQQVIVDPFPLDLAGQAVIGGVTTVRRAVAADNMMQAFAYHALVPSDALWVAVLGRGAARGVQRIVTALPLRISAGGSARVRAEVPMTYRIFSNIAVTLSDPPAGISVSEVSFGNGGLSFTVRADASAIKPGARGNLIAEVSGERPEGQNARNAPPQAAAQRRAVLGTLPAISFEIVK